MDNIRDYLSRDINSLLRLLIDNSNELNYNNFYSGKVVNNIDPEKLGRCQIRVYGIFEDTIPDSDLPWAIPDFEFIGSTIGSFVVPPINAIVKVYFEHGDIYFPHYTTKVIEKKKLSDLRLEDYPDTMIIFETDEGDYLTLNRKSRKFTFHHNSGNNIEILKDGNTNILIKGNKEQIVNKDEMHIVKGDHVIKNNNIGKIEINRNGDILVTGGNVTIDHTIMLDVKGNNVIPTGTGPLNALKVDPITGLPHSGNICF